MHWAFVLMRVRVFSGSVVERGRLEHRPTGPSSGRHGLVRAPGTRPVRLVPLAWAGSPALRSVPILWESSEVDEVYQNAGDKRDPHLDRTSHRADGPTRFEVAARATTTGFRCSKSWGASLARYASPSATRLHGPNFNLSSSRQRCQAVIDSDEWCACSQLDRIRWAVGHKKGAGQDWTRDEDGNGFREVHSNTIEGIWTRLRSSLRQFRGVNDEYLHQDVAIFEWSYHPRTATSQYLRALIGVTSSDAP